MPYRAVADMQMYYSEYGTSDSPPLVLIHGSGGTGATEWKPIVKGLAKKFHVLAPDSRGHGKTLDPRSEYSFELLANDTADFIRAMKIAPAFVVGHSNGGNIALVLTIEHPELVKKAVIMAGNAYVSADLEHYADEKWSKRISPTWGKQLAERHDPLRYAGYWRKLMDRTGYEIARAPNYGRKDLKKVKTPILVIQGSDDTVNAPSHHAEFMAENLGNAKLWVAPNTGHSVHEEHPDEWVERVTKFFAP